MKPDFWRNRRVFVTGHTGFKGAWLCKWLVQMGAVVSGYARQPDPSSHLFELSGLESEIFSQTGDVQDLRLLSQVLNDAQPEVVFHLAAQALVRDSYKSPVETYATNVLGTVHLLEAVRGCPSVKAVVNVTTDKCYENKEWDWPYRESDALGGSDPYSNSKACAELVTQAYRRSFFNQNQSAAVATARAGNVIGGGDTSPERLIPSVLAAWSAGQTIELRNPHAVRPWQYVLEPLRGYLDLAEHLLEFGQRYASSWNFGPRAEDAQPVLSVVKAMANAFAGKCDWTVNSADQPHEAQLLQLDCSKAAKHLGWTPHMHLQESIAHVMDWHRHGKAGKNMSEFMCQRIAAYQENFIPSP
jgi:CDP-glucose 4,6-dehydratase